MADAANAKHLCGYRVVEMLREQCTVLADGPGGRRVVLKRLEEDCMLRGRLHPSVRERLERVRELAHTGVANLHGVGADADQAWLIWEYVMGEPFDAFAADGLRSTKEVRRLARELALAVDSLHQLGIVHGALVPSNVLVSPTGAVRLTHVSPLLFTEPAVDSASLTALLEHVLDVRGERDSALGQLIAEAKSAQMPLALLATKLAVEPTALPQEPGPPTTFATARQARRRALAAAAVVGLLAVVAGIVLWAKLNPHPRAPLPIEPGQEISLRR